MNIEKLYHIQEQLDKTIADKHHLHNKDLVPFKILALEVELGELANETRCFKFWSTKPPAPKATILEEYVDCLHFILSIGLDKGFSNTVIEMQDNEKDLIQQFQQVFTESSQLQQHTKVENYKSLFEAFLTLGEKLDFTWQEIESAYLMKNEVNHQRQEEGY
ncbi:MAG: dUTP diphosphatase [Clostridiaceae bacterium]|nr:dUTP diphosphatase [Clostridiaceae bacterium]